MLEMFYFATFRLISQPTHIEPWSYLRIRETPIRFKMEISNKKVKNNAQFNYEFILKSVFDTNFAFYMKGDRMKIILLTTFHGIY